MIINSFSGASTPSAMCMSTNAKCLRPSARPTFRLLFCLILFLSLLIPAPAREKKSSADKNTLSTGKKVDAPIVSSGISYKSGNRRDPFYHSSKKLNSSKAEDEEISRGLPPPGIAGTYIAQAILEGISIREDRTTAIVRGADKRAYFLREGDRLFDGYVKTIQEDSITLIRETKMRSGKTLTQEVTKRLRTP